MSEEEIKVELAKMDGHINVLQSKITDMHDSIIQLGQGMGLRVEEHGKKIAVLETQVENTKTTAEHIYKKMDGHIKTHWHFIGLAVGILTVISIMLKLLKLF